MEGFLFKKGRGDSSFGRRNWKQRWFVLEGPEFSYYDDFDLQTGEPVGFKGKANLAGCECFPSNHHEKKNTFTIQPKNDKEIYLQAPDPKLLHCENLLSIVLPLRILNAFFVYSVDERNRISCQRRESHCGN
jgi:hypothetical protein